jgi:sugar-specific transcriptional regulator TrmB
MNIQEQLPETFEKAGLSPKEAKIYSCLLTLGGAFPSKIAEETKLNRSTVYKVLLDLSVKGLVNEIKKKNKIYYQIEKPKQLLRYAKERVTIASDDLERMQKILPDIEGLYSLLQNKPKITYFEGLDEILSIYEDHINTKEPYEMTAIANTNELENVFPKKFFENYRRTKEKIGITTRGIITNSEQSNTFIQRMYAGYKKEIVPVMRYVSDLQFPFKGEVTIYKNNKVSIVNLSREQLTGVVIEDQTIYNMIRTMFELSWIGLAK